MTISKAFSPAGISSFFEACDRAPNGNPITNPERVGARGGGFVIGKGVSTEVIVEESTKEAIEVFVNGKLAPEAETTKTVVETLLREKGGTYDVEVRHSVEVPIGAGYGSSAAGALSTALALNEALDLNLTYNQVGRVAHAAEVRCRTGLGTVGPLMLGGCIVTVEPGAPGYALIDRIPLSPGYRIVAGTFQPRLTKEFLTSSGKMAIVNEWGRRTVDAILADPSLENFMRASKEFALKTGLATERVLKLIEAAEEAGAVGAAQNMIGEAVHAVVEADGLKSVLQAFEGFLSKDKMLIAEINFQGAQLL